MMTQRSLASSGVRQCRICLQTEDQSSMVSPCECRGSIQYVHLACLQKYFAYKFKTSHPADRILMHQGLQCQICKSNVHCLELSESKRCVTCEQLQDRTNRQCIFSIIFFMLFHVVFHASGVFMILQDQIIVKVFGAFWLVFTVITLDLQLYKIVKESCFVSDAQINQVDFA